MTGPYITSLLSIPVSDEAVVEKGVTVSKKIMHMLIYITPFITSKYGVNLKHRKYSYTEKML